MRFMGRIGLGGNRCRNVHALLARQDYSFDLVVFDESHKLAAVTENHRIRKTRRYELAEALAGGGVPADCFAGLGWPARHLLLLTATPHMGKDSPWHLAEFQPLNNRL